MKKTILLFLRSEAARKDAPTYHSLDTYLAKMYPKATGKEVKAVLLELQNEGLAAFSGSWTSLGARFAGVEQNLQNSTIHAHLTPKGLDAANELAGVSSATAPAANVPTPPVTPGVPPKLPATPPLPKTPATPVPAGNTPGSPTAPAIPATTPSPVQPGSAVPPDHSTAAEGHPGNALTNEPNHAAPGLSPKAEDDDL